MKGRASVLILLAALGCLTSWLLGYHEGQRSGAFQLLRQANESCTRDVKNDMDTDRDQVCNEIRRYKLSMAKDLDENTQICLLAGHGRPKKIKLTHYPILPSLDICSCFVLICFYAGFPLFQPADRSARRSLLPRRRFRKPPRRAAPRRGPRGSRGAMTESYTTLDGRDFILVTNPARDWPLPVRCVGHPGALQAACSATPRSALPGCARASWWIGRGNLARSWEARRQPLDAVRRA